MTREEEIRQYLKERNIPITSLEANSIIEGIEWADENPTPCSVRMVGSQSYSKQELREMGFAFDLNGNVLSPNHLAKKAAHYVIKKAEKWLENFLEKTIQKPSINEGYTSDTIDLVESNRHRLIEEVLYDFKKAMEG